MLNIDDITKAREVLAGIARCTPLLPTRTFSRLSGGDVYLKVENTQRTGSFKIRGAYVKIKSLTRQQRQKGVIAASAGNHAQGVAIAAAMTGTRSVVVMPETAPLAKVTATRDYGAEVILKGNTYDEACAYAQDLQHQMGLTFIHPFDDWKVMAGQGTIGLEILDALPDVDAAIVPIGGGGLIAGVATALKAHQPKLKVIGVQAAGASSCYQSFKRGVLTPTEEVNTIADGIAVKCCGTLTFPVIQRLVDDVVTVEDDAIVHSIFLLLERSKLLVEGAGAVGLAALMAGRIKLPRKKVVLLLSGGNIDVNLLARLIEHGLTAAGRYLVIRVSVLDKPGQLLGLLRVLADKRVNILQIEHHRTGLPLPVNQAEVELTLETRDPEHCAEIMGALKAAGYEVWRTW
ncbi:MAG: threonine ammonia-lyase [Chloroflexi bacterium]|nr:threonine ammonia-lyase [Chloroflexota bacterium]